MVIDSFLVREFLKSNDSLAVDGFLSECGSLGKTGVLIHNG